MLLQNRVFIAKSFSTPANILHWRAQIKQHQLASQIYALLFQRRNWVPLLETLDLSSEPTTLPSCTAHNRDTPPNISRFLQLSQDQIGFGSKPQVALPHDPCTGLLGQFSAIEIHFGFAYSVSRIADSMIRAPEGSNSCRSSTLSFVIGSYSHNGVSIEGLEVFRKMRMCGLRSSADACNALLDALQQKDEIALTWCIYVGMIRAHVLEDRITWSLIAQILSKGRKYDRIVALLDLGIESSVLYNAQILSKGRKFDRIVALLDSGIDSSVLCNVVIDHYSKNGKFEERL